MIPKWLDDLDRAERRRATHAPWEWTDCVQPDGPEADCGNVYVVIPESDKTGDDAWIARTVGFLYFGDMENNTGEDIANAELIVQLRNRARDLIDLAKVMLTVQDIWALTRGEEVYAILSRLRATTYDAWGRAIPLETQTQGAEGPDRLPLVSGDEDQDSQAD